MTRQKPSELYGFQTSNCLRAAIALEESEIPYLPRIVQLPEGEHRRREFLELNAIGQVPVLIDYSGPERLVLSQSNAIIFHAADRAGDRLISKSDARVRALTYERYFYFLTDVITVNHAIFHLGGFVGDSSHRILRGRAIEALSFTERFVADTRYMAGDDFSIADVAALTVTQTLARHIDWDHLPALRRWFMEVVERPSVIRGLAAFSQSPSHLT